jgi:CubicO group peptidase (beta-lactamase class C family)
VKIRAAATLPRPRPIEAIPNMYRLTLLALFSTCTLAAAQPNPAGNLEGLWGASHRFGPQARGILVIDGRNEDWVAHIAGFDVAFKPVGDSISFALPSQLGEFRGVIAEDHRSIKGHWFQPPAVLGGSFASAVLGGAFASPVSLAAVSENVWKGVASPLRDELSLYLMIEAGPEGAITAFIRNPETNFCAGHTFTVELNGRLVELADTRSASWNLEGTYDAAADRLTLDVPLQVSGKSIFVAFDFLRQGRDEALGFYPRRTPAEQYQYRTPIGTDDGWQTAALEEVGMRTQPVTDAIKGIMKGEQRAIGTPCIQGVLAARHGKLVLEEYFYGFDQSRLHDLRSVGNSITSALVGIALDKGVPFTLSSPVCPLFPEYKSFANPDPRKEKITVQDLMTMTSGLAGNDRDESSPGNEAKMFMRAAAGTDYYKVALDLPMATDPGGPTAIKFTAGINLLGGVVRNATGTPLIDFFVHNFAAPLDIRRYYLNLTPTGDIYGGGGMYLLSRDALKLGQVYLSGGTWNGRRIVSQKWVELSTRRYSEYSPQHGYGLAWHLFEIEAGGKAHAEFEAEGNGGQVIAVIPDLDLSVLFTTGNYDEDETVPERAILTAIMGAAL